MSVESLRDDALGAAFVTALLERAEGRSEVVRLTDEELAVLDGDGAQVAPSPWLTSVPVEHRETAMAVAARNLVVRGLALPSVLEDPTGRLSIALPEDVHAVLAARRAASVVVIAQRSTADAGAARVLYGQGEPGVVEEDVTPGGLHTFSASSWATAVEGLARYADPAGWATTAGAGREIPLDAIAAGDVSAAPAGSHYVTVVTVVAIGPDGEPAERRLSAYAGPDGVSVSEPIADRPAVAVRPVGPAELLEAVRGVVAA